MNLLFDLTATQPDIDGKFHGGGKYAKEIYLAVIQNNYNKVNIVSVYDSRIYIDKEIICYSKKFNVRLIDLQNTSWDNICNDNQVDRIYSGAPMLLPHPIKWNCEVIGTIHDLRELEINLDSYALKYYSTLKEKIKIVLVYWLNKISKRKYKKLKNLVENFKIYTVSNHSKYSIISYFPEIDENNISVYYSPNVIKNDIIPDKEWLEKDYFLMVSGNRWIKNNLRSAIAIDEIFSEKPHLKNKVIITGVNNKKIYLRHLKNKDRFTFYDYVDEAFLYVLYKNAFAFLYMSLNEGFGYPPLEAMKHGVPVIASPFASLTEICSNAVLYANPYSIKEIKNRILYLFNKEVHLQLSVKGKEQFDIIKEKQEYDLERFIHFLLTADTGKQLSLK